MADFVTTPDGKCWRVEHVVRPCSPEEVNQLYEYPQMPKPQIPKPIDTFNIKSIQDEIAPYLC